MEQLILLLEFDEEETLISAFVNFIMHFPKTNASVETVVQPGTNPEIKYNMPYSVGDIPINLSMSPEKQLLSISKEIDEKTYNFEYSTDMKSAQKQQIQ